MKNILLLGYDSNICLGVSYCLSRMGNCRLFLLTNNKRNAGKYSRFIKKTYYYEQQRLEISDINNIIKKEDIHLVFPYDENEGIYISENTRYISTDNTKCIWLTDPKNYQIGVNKLLLAKLLFEANINTPPFAQNINEDVLMFELSKWNGPLIMKPARSSFGRGIIKFADRHEAQKHIRSNKIDLAQYFFQPFITGSDLTINVIADRGKILYYTIQETPIKTNAVFVSGDDFEFKEDEVAIDLVAKAINHLDWHGIACFDLRRDAKTGELYILEINGRFWASLLAAFKKGGINFPALLAKLSFGEAVSRPSKIYESQISMRNFIKHTLSCNYKKIEMTKYGTYLTDPLARFFQLTNR